MFFPNQLRADAFFGESASAVHAPNIHGLASRSTTFERAYVTHPVCAASRTFLLSGTWPHVNGCIKNSGALLRNLLCLPEMVGDSDYRAGYFGKWHLGDEFSAQHWFEEWLGVDEYFKSAATDHGHNIEGVSDYTKFLLSKGYKPNRCGKYFDNIKTRTSSTICATIRTSDEICFTTIRSRTLLRSSLGRFTAGRSGSVIV